MKGANVRFFQEKLDGRRREGVGFLVFLSESGRIG
jgi:hypothetical protein